MARWFSFKPQGIRQASTLLVAAAVASSALGLVRNLIFYRFVPAEQLDIYFASFRIADFVFGILILGAITSAVIPTLSELIGRKEEKKAHLVTNQLLSWATVFLGVLLIVMALGMTSLISWLMPGFEGQRLADTVLISRLVLIQTIFYAWSFIIGSLLNGYKRFAAYALAPLAYNLSLIVGGIAAGTYGVIVIGYAVIIGSFLHLCIQFYESRKAGFQVKPNLETSPELLMIGRLMIPRSISQGTSQAVLLIYTSLASTLQAGSIAIFNGMNDLQAAPMIIIANSLATAALPTLAVAATKPDPETFERVLIKVIRITLYLTVPMIFLAWILRAQIVRLYFGSGGASWELTDLAIATFSGFLIGIVPACLVAILVRVFYAMKDTRTPMLVSFFTSIVGICFSLIAISNFNGNVATLALSEALIISSQCILYLAILTRRFRGSLRLGQVVPTALHALAGSAAAAFAAWGVLQAVHNLYQTIPWLSTERIVGLFAQGLIAGTFGILVYLGYSHLTKQEELTWIRRKGFSLNR